MNIYVKKKNTKEGRWVSLVVFCCPNHSEFCALKKKLHIPHKIHNIFDFCSGFFNLFCMWIRLGSVSKTLGLDGLQLRCLRLYSKVQKFRDYTLIRKQCFNMVYGVQLLFHLVWHALHLLFWHAAAWVMLKLLSLYTLEINLEEKNKKPCTVYKWQIGNERWHNRCCLDDSTSEISGYHWKSQHMLAKTKSNVLSRFFSIINFWDIK